MIRWLCRHRHCYREARGGVLHLVCPDCGTATPALTRTRAEQAKATRLQRRLQAKPAAVVEKWRKRA